MEKNDGPTNRTQDSALRRDHGDRRPDPQAQPSDPGRHDPAEQVARSDDEEKRVGEAADGSRGGETRDCHAGMGRKGRRERRVKQWVFTVNNPGGSPGRLITFFNGIGAAFIFQLEEGEEGTPHWQGCFKLKCKKSFSVLQRGLTAACGKGPHLEACKALPAAIAYCQKLDGRLAGPWAGGGDGFAIQKAPTDRFDPARCTAWQQDLLSVLQEEPDDRTVHWYYEACGGVGKSTLARHLCGWAFAGRCIIVNGKAGDIYNRFIAHAREYGAPVLVLIDIPRCSSGHFSIAAAEAMKNGLISSGKYEGGQLVFDSPHVVVFANEPPPWGKMSLDRWRVRHIQADGSFLVEEGPVRDEPTSEYAVWDVLA